MKAKIFQATLERMRSRLNWVIVPIPFDAAKAWGNRGQIRVRGDINGFEFRTSLFPDGRGGHYLLVNRNMQKTGKVRAGQVARFRMEPDRAERTVSLPSELEKIFAQNRSLKRWFERLNFSAQSEICKWVCAVKGGESRVRRAEQIAERMLATMEAERELPPILKIAFANNPHAAAGWNKMSVSRRRGHLLGIFGYKSPESRNKRLAKAIEDAVRVADTGSSTR
jgi:uncharacterized protein YdeI (YjbR/CyaY-like superfamily)